jgi:MATE family multidrug resistance protein
MVRLLRKRWSEAGGYADILRLAFPLVLGTNSWTIQQIVDRIFLSWFSPEAAAMPAGMINISLMSIFTGAAGYVSAFTAQYAGAKRDGEIGPLVWQGLYLSLLAGVLVLPLLPLSSWIFDFFGHPAGVVVLERTYFNILLAGAFPAAASSALAGYFSGLGKTRTVMWVTFAAVLSNIVLDYLMILGKWGCPVMGIGGAAVATVVSQVVSMAIYAVLILHPSGGDRFRFRSAWKPDAKPFLRLLRFGLPGGFQFFLESSGFTLFLILVGRFGTTALAATNITFNINNLAFMPMIGFGTAVSVLVGRRLGENRPDLAERDAWRVFEMTFAYMACVAFGYFFIPEIFILPYAMKSDPSGFAPVAGLAVRLLKFVAFYSLFDTANIVFSAAVKGAGDTRFVMWASMLMSWILMVLPSFLVIRYTGGSIYILWGFATLYITALGLVFLFCFIQGKWKRMRVIEPVLVNG